MFDRIRKIIGYRTDKNYWFKNQVDEGYKTFQETGKTPAGAYESLIKLYCVTNGKYTEDLNNKIKSINLPKTISGNVKGITGTYDINDFNETNKTLNEKGYVHFEKKLSKELCEKLHNYALNTPALIPPNYNNKILYNPEKPEAEIYRFDMNDLINNSEIQQLIMDPVFINIARNYLGCEPIFDFPAMWWSTDFQKEASSEAAQLFHFDLDRVKWLKVFFYITEVTPDNGPHCYIEGSHKINSKPAELLERGYARIPDSDLQPYYKIEAFKIVCGEAGSMFIGDTKCWHKGTNVKKGNRLVLDFEYTSSLFGANYPKLEVVNSSQEFKDFCAKNKTFASNIHFKK